MPCALLPRPRLLVAAATSRAPKGLPARLAPQGPWPAPGAQAHSWSPGSRRRAQGRPTHPLPAPGGWPRSWALVPLAPRRRAPGPPQVLRFTLAARPAPQGPRPPRPPLARPRPPGPLLTRLAPHCPWPAPGRSPVPQARPTRARSHVRTQ